MPRRLLVSLVFFLGCGDGGGAADTIDAGPGTPDASAEQADGAPPGPPDGSIPTEPFSFFVTSLRALQDLSGSSVGFGGDLRFGETGPGAGLRGADKICAAIAERSMPGAGAKPWRAFLSATADEHGDQVNAIERIGPGPWYDRLGRLVAPTLDDLRGTRPANGDPAIADDLPNEDGVPNHQPDTLQPEVDNHDTMTGTDDEGMLYDATSTCEDWTSSGKSSGRPRCGHSWPRRGGGGMGGPGGGSMNNWMSALNESGCAPSVDLIEMGPPDPSAGTVGSGGGYGGFYCFSLVP